MSVPEHIIEQLTQSAVASQRRFPGGDISGASEVRLTDGRVLVAKHGPAVDVEARMLQAIGRSGTPAPQILGQRSDTLLIERLPDDGTLSGAAWGSLAEALEILHAVEGDSYGWNENYALRHVIVQNSFCEDWPQFWADRRLLCHLPHVSPSLARRLETLGAKLPEILPASPSPALLHGDLWGGNVLVSENKVSGLIDPCAYFGHREVDIANLTIFDNPPEDFFDTFELDARWQERQPVYRLWIWLVHARLFGESYNSAVDDELSALGF